MLTPKQGRRKQKHTFSSTQVRIDMQDYVCPDGSDWLDPCSLLEDFKRAKQEKRGIVLSQQAHSSMR